MPKQTLNNVRRRFLKGAVFASALSIGGLSSLVFASSVPTRLDPFVDDNIKVIQKTFIDRESVTLVNTSEKLQMIDVQTPISLIQKDDVLLVKVNQSDTHTNNGTVVMAPNERITFDVKVVGLDITEGPDMPVMTNLAQNELKIISDHPVFNRIVLVDLV